MRAWILAAVAALAVGQAEARTYTLEAQGPMTPIMSDGWAQPANNFWIKITFDPDRGSIEQTADYRDISGDAVSMVGPVKAVSYRFGEFSGSFSIAENSFLTLTYGAPGEVNFNGSSQNGGHLIFGLTFLFPLIENDDFLDAFGTFYAKGTAFVVDETLQTSVTGAYDIAEFTLSAVPLPASAFLLIGALAGLGSIRRIKAAGSQSAT